MTSALRFPDLAAAALLSLLATPTVCRSLDLEDWDRVVRVGRSSRLLAALRRRLAARGVLAEVPSPVRNHLDSEAAVARYRKQMAVRDMHQLAAVLGSPGFPVVLLKGAAYIAQGLALADGRLVSDVDLLVPRAHLAQAEKRLLEAGWEASDVDPYDERYYREWSHEVPPMRYPGNALELDLHHAILPPIARVTADPAKLFAAARPVPSSPFRVLAPEDQVLHACVHVFADSDLADRLRDIVDLDELLRAFGPRPGFWPRLCDRADELGLARSLWYGLRYAALLVGASVPEDAWRRLAAHAPGPVRRRLMDFLVANALPPVPLDGAPPLAQQLARTLALARYFRMRMPWPVLLRHAVVKSARLLRSAPSSAS